MFNTAAMLGLAVVLVILNAMFVAAEFAFVRVRETRLKLLANSGSTRAKSAIFGQKHLEDYLSVCQLGITLSSLGLGWLGEPAVARLLKPLFFAMGAENPALIQSLSVIVGFSIITFVHVTFGELAPKNLSIRAAESTVLFLAIPMQVFHYIFRPFVAILNSSAQLVLHVLGVANLKQNPAHSTEELKLLIADSKNKGQLDEVEERLLNNIFNMDRRVARDIMVHRIKVDSIPVETTPQEARDLIISLGRTRLPVYENDKDNIIGFIHAKDLIINTPSHDLRPFLRAALNIYENLPTDSILEMMRREKTKLGLVWDEYGSFQGLITMEDVLEAIVGEIQDEFDREEDTIRIQPDGEVLALTTVTVDELTLHLPLRLEFDTEANYHSLAALLAGKFSEVPKLGET
jgi:CBS domain containing-hemolysin-like protein